jgi:tRNA (cmo5U34)-methyltransferase
MKSTVEQIRERFDQDVERFSSLETGHTAIIDSLLMLDTLTRAAAAVTPQAVSLLDIGCGAGNYTLKMLGVIPDLQVTLVDLSQPMLDRALERIRPATRGSVTAFQADIRDLPLPPEQFDMILAGAVFHHLRSDDEWRVVFRKCFLALKPGGAMWIADMIEHETAPVQALMWARYGVYLVNLGGEAYRDQVFAYIDREDTPRSLNYQLEVLRSAGFAEVEILHKNGCFAAFGGIKAGSNPVSP